MKIKRFRIPIYEYDVIYVELEKTSGEADAIEKLLISIGATTEDINEMVQDVKDSRSGGGNHFYNFRKEISLIIIDPHKDIVRKTSTIAHEKRHMEDRILQHFKIDDIESAGLLSGYLAKYIP